MSFPRLPLKKQRDVDYQLGRLLGRGNFTSVYHAVELSTGTSVAMKMIDRYRCERLHKTPDIWMEKHVLQRLNHPNIAKLYNHFTDSITVYVVLEECAGGELWELVKTIGCCDRVARHWFAQLLSAMTYLRQARIVHRDLKAENVMMKEGMIKLIDFGTAKDLENPQIKGAGNKSRNKVFENYVGTPQFMAPEVIENKCTDFRSDTWSLGCLFFQVLVGAPPFHGLSEYLIFMRIKDLDLKFPQGINTLARDLIVRMVVQVPDARLGAHDLAQIMAHPFFAGVAFEDPHLVPTPVLSLVDCCLQRIGRHLTTLFSDVFNSSKLSLLSAEVQERLKRMQTVQEWLDAATPPDH